MSRSYHVTERQRKRDHYLNRDNEGNPPEGLSHLDELSLKKSATKETENWRRDTQKIGGLRHIEFTFKDGKGGIRKQKCRGKISDVPGEILEPKPKHG